MNSPSTCLPQATIDALKCAFAIKSSSGIILSCNQAFIDMNRDYATNLVGLTAHDYLPNREADFYTQADVELLKNPRGFLSFQFERQLQNRSSLSFNVHKSLAEAEDGSKEILIVINKPPHASSASAINPLTPREHAVLELLVKGNSQKQIAISLNISHHTASDHLKAIYTKLNVRSRTQAQLKGIMDLGMY